MAAPDATVNVGPPPAAAEPPVKPPPSKLPGWLQSKRNKALAGLGLLTLIAVPAIVAPSVVAAQHKAERERQAAIARSRDPDSTSFVDGQRGAPRDSTFNASALDAPGGSGTGNATARNGTLAVPQRTTADKALADLKKPERWTPFVRIKDGQFDRHCRPFYPVGFNAFELTTLAATGRRADVDAVFKSAANMGMTAARTWAHSISQKFPFQTEPGKYDPSGLEALDYVIASASKHGVKLILSFIDNWKYYNGVDQYVDWCGPGRSQELPKESGGDTDTQALTDSQKRYETQRHALFFKEEACKKLYQDNVDFITSRKNSITGVRYRDDPTILAWNLINEPRCETWVAENSWCPDAVKTWFQEMAEYVKKVDPNHLVTSGSEGFFGAGDPNVAKNPQSWASQTGQNFVDDNRHMDFAVTHAWPDNWFIPDAQQGEFLREWLDSHLTAAETIGKPLLFEEFGKKLDGAGAADIAQLRDPVYQASYQAVEDAIEKNRPLLGSLYWKWAVPGVERGPYGVDLEDSTMSIIRDHAELMHRLTNAVPPRPSCVFPASDDKPVGAWFASAPEAAGARGAAAGADADTVRDCINAPDVSLAFYALYGPRGRPNATAEQLGLSKAAVLYARGLRKGQTRVFPTKRECCMPALGAYVAGCSAQE